MKILISGGGTGGHIYPALAIAKKIKEKYENANILYVGTEKGMEAELVPKEGFKFETIRVKGFTRKLSMDTLKTTGELFLGLKDAVKIINEFKPDVVVGTGGYVCGPLVFIASMKGIPTVIHEANALPGVTNKILSKLVNKVTGSFEECKKYFKDPSKVVITGNPIRQDIVKIDKKGAYKDLKLDENKKFILSFGGSGGQKSLNDAMLDLIEKEIDKSNFQLLHVTGKRFYDKFMKSLEDKDIDLSKHSNIKVLPYLFEMPKALAASDLIITGAGAMTLSEITAIGKPSILIPKAYTTENHQEYNARAMESNNASMMILEKELTGDKLEEIIYNIINDEKKLKEMAENSKKLGKIDSDERILVVIEKLLNM